MRNRPPVPNYNNNKEENNYYKQNSNYHRPPPSSKDQLNNQSTTTKGINSPFASPFTSNPNQQNNDYKSNFTEQKDNYPPPKKAIPPPKKYSNKEQQETPEENNYDSNNKNYNNNDNTPDADDDYINKDNYQEEKHKTSQAHKTPDKNYSINPSQIPRPNQSDEIYLNNEKIKMMIENGIQVKNQIDEKEKKMKSLLSEKYEEGQKMKKLNDDYFTAVEMIRKEKIDELKRLNIKDKYILPVEKYKPVKKFSSG